MAHRCKSRSARMAHIQTHMECFLDCEGCEVLLARGPSPASIVFPRST